MPGVRVGVNALLGSGCATRPGATYAPGSVWVGSRGAGGEVGEGTCLAPGTPLGEAGKQVRGAGGCWAF